MRAPSIKILGCCITLATFGFGATAFAHEGAGGDVGIGVGVGAPTALSLEIAPRPSSAFELALGLPIFTPDELYAHLVFKQDFVRLAHGPTVVVPLYLGVGAFVRENDPMGVHEGGARVPLGVNFDFTRAAVQIFAEGALDVTLASNVDTPHPVGVDGMAGARIWF
jgi:hypothetical protein